MSTVNSAPAYTQEDLDYVASVFPEVNEIQSAGLREAVKEIWVDVWKSSSWKQIQDVPKNPKNVSHDHVLSDHIRSVTNQALATADIMQRFHGITYDRDLLIAAGLLHDVSKLVEYETREGQIGESQFGHLIQHGAYGAHKAWEKELPVELVHNILAHTHNSKSVPATWEAIIIHYVDYLDSDALLYMSGQKLLLKK